MDIVLASTELAPYARVGSAADVVAALSKTLRQHGHKVTVVLPRHAAFEQAGLLVARRLTPLSFQMGGTQQTVTVYDCRIASGVDVTLLDWPGLAERGGVYGNDAGDFADNPAIFALFSRAVLELIRQRTRSGAPPDLVHLHDWSTALVPVYAKSLEQEPGAERIRYVLSIHNLEHQGIVDRSMLSSMSLPESLFHPDGVEFYGKINMLKAGILFADAVTTVSSQYALDIKTPAHGHGLDGVIAFHAANLTGIGNGIDVSIWNPATDPAIISRYDAEDCSGKTLCKAASLTDLRLDLATERPLITLAQRLDTASGFAAFMDCFNSLMKSDVSLIVIGSGDAELERRLCNAITTFPGRVAWINKMDDAAVRRSLAASDFVLVPTPYEPCGHLHQGGQRYGCVPIAHAAGGLRDAIVDCDAQLETGTGFLFDTPDSSSILGAIQRALAAYNLPRFASLRRRAMRLDVGWDRPAFRYEVLYRSLVPAVVPDAS